MVDDANAPRVVAHVRVVEGDVDGGVVESERSVKPVGVVDGARIEPELVRVELGGGVVERGDAADRERGEVEWQTGEVGHGRTLDDALRADAADQRLVGDPLANLTSARNGRRALAIQTLKESKQLRITIYKINLIQL